MSAGAGRFNKRVELYNYDVAADDEGFGATYEWTLKATIWAQKLKPRFVNSIQEGTNKAVALTQGLVIRSRADIAKGWRVKTGGVMYDVIHIDDSTPRELTLTLQACEVQV